MKCANCQKSVILSHDEKKFFCQHCGAGGEVTEKKQQRHSPGAKRRLLRELLSDADPEIRRIVKEEMAAAAAAIAPASPAPAPNPEPQPAAPPKADDSGRHKYARH